jgi:hypothetical protein
MVAKQLITKGVKGVVEAIAPVAKELTGGELALKKFVDTDPKVMAIRANKAKVNTGGRGYGSGSQYRGKRKTQTLGARSAIASRPRKMIEAYPDEKDKIERWMRQAYAYARDPSKGTKRYPLKGYRNYIGPDGRRWRPKPSQGAFEGYQLKGDDQVKRAATIQRRTNRERPWTKPDQQDLINDALLKIGKEHLYDDLIALMIKDYNTAMNKIKLGGQTKGHFISMKNGGLDVAENFGPQAGKSKIKVVGGQKLKIKGNYAEKADSTVGFGAGKGVDNWDDYVRMKLSQLE